MDKEIILVGGNDKLDAIVSDKIKELEIAKMKLPLAELKKRLGGNNQDGIRDFYGSLCVSKYIALIAEIKKASPSAGDINVGADILAQARAYEVGGARALSVLTDAHFKGELNFLRQIKNVTTIPILRKDFIFDPYQIYESKYFGADALLLIASIMSTKRLNELVDLTHVLGMRCLVESHNQEDLAMALTTKAEILGINARDLRTFEVDLKNITDLSQNIPDDRLLVAESGIENRADVLRLKNAGAKAILVGTTLMKATDLPAKIKELSLR